MANSEDGIGLQLTSDALDLVTNSLAKLQFGHRSLATANRRRKRSRKGRKKKTHGVLDAPLKNGASSLSKKKRQRSKGGKRTRVLRLAAIAAGISQHKPVWKQQQYAPLAAEMRKDPQAAVPGFFKMLEVELPSESDLGMSEELRALFKLS